MIDTNKLQKLLEEIALEQGAFTLFGLFLREGQWALLVSAPWLEKGKLEAFGYLSERVVPRLTEKELLSLSRMESLNEGDPALEAILHTLRIEGGPILQGENLFGLEIQEALVLMPNTKGLKRIAEEVMEEMTRSLHFSQNPFGFRGRGLMQKERGSPIWRIALWFRGDEGIDVELTVRPDTTDDEIRNQIRQAMENRLGQLGQGDKLDAE